MGETEVEIALCYDCQRKLCRNEWLPFYSPKPKELLSLISKMTNYTTLGGRVT